MYFLFQALANRESFDTQNETMQIRMNASNAVGAHANDHEIDDSIHDESLVVEAAVNAPSDGQQNVSNIVRFFP